MVFFVYLNSNTYKYLFFQHSSYYRQHDIGVKHVFKENPADDYVANPHRLTQTPFWSYDRGFLKTKLRRRVTEKSYHSSSIPGLDTYSYVNYIP